MQLENIRISNEHFDRIIHLVSFRKKERKINKDREDFRKNSIILTLIKYLFLPLSPLSLSLSFSLSFSIPFSLSSRNVTKKETGGTSPPKKKRRKQSVTSNVQSVAFIKYIAFPKNQNH